MAELHAQPYSGAAGFDFDSPEKFDAGMKKLLKRGVEEVEIQFIDGDDEDAQLFATLDISQSQIDQWYDDIEPLREHEKIALYVLSDRGYGLDEALGKVDDVHVFEGTVQEYAEERADDAGGPMQLFTNSESYFDFEAFGRDLRINGDDTRMLYDDLEEAKTERDDAKKNLDESEDDDTSVEEMELEEAQERVDELDSAIEDIEDMTDAKRGEQWIDDVYGGVEHLDKGTQETYFDYASVARDMEAGGEVSTMTFGGTDYVVEEH
jgi:DNA repair exonuclease SbcCD ATPase subunit